MSLSLLFSLETESIFLQHEMDFDLRMLRLCFGVVLHYENYYIIQ